MDSKNAGATHQDRDGNLWRLHKDKWYRWENKWIEFHMIDNVHKFRECFGIKRIDK